MRKYLIGCLIGFILSLPISAHADEIIQSIVGKEVQGQFPVKIEGQQLETMAAVIDGTSYLPVRAVGEALDMNVSFDADLGIELTEKEENSLAETPAVSEPVVTKSKQEIKDEIEAIKELMMGIKMFLNSPGEITTEARDKSEKALADYEQQIADLEAQLSELEGQ